MTTVCLNNQIFYVPPVAAGPEPASRGLRIREGDPSAAICGVPLHPPLPQDAHDPHRGSAGESQADAILIPSDDEFDDLDEGRSDTSFESLDGLLLDARNKVQSGRVTGTGKGVDAAPDDSDAPEPSVSSMADPDNESPASPIALHTEQDRPVPASPASRRALVCAGSSCRQGDGCAKHPNLSAFYRRLRNAKSPKAKADNEGSEGDEPEPADAGLPLQPPYSQDRINFRRDVGGQCNTNLEADHRPACPPVPDDRGEQNGMCPAAPPQVVESHARTPTPSDDESTGELEPADAEPRVQPQSPCGAATGHGVDPQQRSGSCHPSQHRDHHDDSDQASDLEQRHPLVPDDRGEQDEDGTPAPRDRRAASKSTKEKTTQQQGNPAPAAEASPVKPAGILLTPGTGTTRRKRVSFGHDVKQGSGGTARASTTGLPDECPGKFPSPNGSVVQPQAQEGRASILRLSDDESNNDREVAHTEPSMQRSASQEQVNLQHNIGRRRRRRRCDTDGEEDCSPIVGSDAEQAKDEDIVRPPRGKRRRVNTSAPTTRRTAPKRQTPLHCTNSPPLQAQIPPPTRGPKRRQSQRSISKPQSSRGSALEEETLEAAFASFEEWPLEAVLKRVLVDGVATFQVEFTWNPCANHGRNGHTPENWRRKSPAGRTSSTGRALPLRVASTAEQVQVQVRGAKYFQVEDIQGWRQGEEGREYLVKWEGYGHKQNTWEPATHFEKCPEVLEEFHQKAGLSTAPS